MLLMKNNIIKARIKRNAFEIKESLEPGDCLVFQGEGVTSSKNVTSNEDGTCNVVSDIKPILLEIKKVDNGFLKQVFKDKLDKRSRSFQLRSLIYKLWVERGKKGTFKGFYNEIYDYFDTFISNKIDQEVMGV